MLTLSLDQNNRTSNGIAVHHLPYSNLMFDKRVVKGNVFANSRNAESAWNQSLEDGSKNVSSSKKQFSSSPMKSTKRNAWARNTPEPVEGRQHIKLQTELYLEELSGVIEEMDASCQTDPFLNRPPTPLFIPAKTGMDQETQIYDGDLFDFDLEVQPILEVLVGKVTEQALIEVMEEEELASLRERQKIFEELREAELQEQQRLEELERRKQDEKLRIMKQQEERIRQEKETAEKIAAKVYSQKLLTDLVPSVMASLSENGFFYDPVEREIETIFFPRLLGKVKKNLCTHMTARKLLDGLIRETVGMRMKMQHSLESPDKLEEDADVPADDQEPDVEREAEAKDATTLDHEPEATEEEAPVLQAKISDDELPLSPAESDAEMED